jgi:GNAT superfamily N-acetyltransferase
LNIEVRPGVPEDVPVIARLIRELAEYERLSDQMAATEAQLHEALFGSRRYAEVRLATNDAVPIAFALYFFNFSTFLARPVLYIEDLFTLPEWRGKGAGNALFQNLIQIARDRDCGRIEWSVLDWNAAAIGFYERLGAKAQTEWVRYRLDEEQIARLA